MDEINVEEKLIDMMDEYYGDNRGNSFKKEAAEFISNYLEDIRELAESAGV